MAAGELRHRVTGTAVPYTRTIASTARRSATQRTQRATSAGVDPQASASRKALRSQAVTGGGSGSATAVVNACPDSGWRTNVSVAGAVPTYLATTLNT